MEPQLRQLGLNTTLKKGTLHICVYRNKRPFLLSFFFLFYFFFWGGRGGGDLSLLAMSNLNSGQGERCNLPVEVGCAMFLSFFTGLHLGTPPYTRCAFEEELIT